MEEGIPHDQKSSESSDASSSTCVAAGNIEELAVEKPDPQLAAKMKAWKEAKTAKSNAEVSGDQKAVAENGKVGESSKQLVPTPARANAKASHALPKYTVPNFVLESLAAKAPLPPKPFAVTGEGDDEGEQGKEKKMQVKASAKPKASPKTKMKLAKIARGRKKTQDRVEIAGPEVEQALELLPAQATAEPEAQLAEPQQVVPAEETVELETELQYKPKAFAEVRKCYISGLRKEGFSYKAASEQWMLSTERSDLLSGMSLQELKRRRFV